MTGKTVYFHIIETIGMDFREIDQYIAEVDTGWQPKLGNAYELRKVGVFVIWDFQSRSEQGGDVCHCSMIQPQTWLH